MAARCNKQWRRKQGSGGDGGGGGSGSRVRGAQGYWLHGREWRWFDGKGDINGSGGGCGVHEIVATGDGSTEIVAKGGDDDGSEYG